MKKLSLILSSLLILFLITNSFAEEKFIKGKATVIDGDTIKIQGKSIRLSGIDAPEMKQLCFRNDVAFNCGLSAKMHLELLIKKDKGKASCRFESLDRYGRILGNCGGLNTAMVADGWAVAYTRYSDEYLPLQKIAKKQMLGLWATKFDYPEDWGRKYK